ncbi:MAG: 3-isopropylmalate dehydratase small subunit [Myxococcota bacterium]|nr:3-isopropylmalate dehydratase small subunit [Myxococcota bacterium]
MNPISGLAIVMGDHVNTDILHPSWFYSLDAGKVAAGFMGGMAEKDNARALAGPRIIIAGRDFGAGSSRETTIYSLIQNDVRAIVCVSAGVIFTRNAINCGLPLFHLAEPFAAATGGAVRIEPGASRIVSASGAGAAALKPMNSHFQHILEAGGLEAYARKTGLAP